MLLFESIKNYILILLASFLLSGCSFKKNFDPLTREKNELNYTQVGVLVLDNNIIVQNSIDEGALFGMIHGASHCFQAGGGEATLLYGLVCLPIGVTTGMAAGIKESWILSELKKEEGTIEAKISIPDIQKKLGDITIKYLQENSVKSALVDINTLRNDDGSINYSLLAIQGIDSAIEFKIEKVSLNEAGIIGVPVFITLEVTSRLVKTTDGRTIAELKKKVISNVHQYSEWIADDFKILKREYQELLETVAKTSVDEYLLLYYPLFSKDFTSVATQRNAPYYILYPYYPELQFSFGSQDQVVLIEGALEAPLLQRFVKIKEEKPLLKWESFPWNYDQTLQEHFSDITYDLEIYKYKGSLAYARIGLKENQHQVEYALQRGEKYLWTVRAKFKMDGKPRVTEWSGLYENTYPAWMFGDESIVWYKRMRNAPLSSKRYFYYPFMIIEE